MDFNISLSSLSNLDI